MPHACGSCCTQNPDQQNQQLKQDQQIYQDQKNQDLEMSTPDPRVSLIAQQLRDAYHDEPRLIKQGEASDFHAELGIDMVDLVVGSKQLHYHVHKKILCEKVPYFEKMFEGGFLEATDNQAAFPEEDVHAFDLLLSWIYKNKFPEYEVNTNGEGSSQGIKLAGNWDVATFYALAEKFCIPLLQDQIMDAYRKGCRQGYQPLIASVTEILDGYARTSAGSGLRKFYLRTAVFLIVEWKDADCSNIDLAEMMTDKDLAVDIISLLRCDQDHAKNPLEYRACEFHTHGLNELCPQGYNYEHLRKIPQVETSIGKKINRQNNWGGCGGHGGGTESLGSLH